MLQTAGRFGPTMRTCVYNLYGVLMAVINDRCVLHLTAHNSPPGTRLGAAGGPSAPSLLPFWCILIRSVFLNNCRITYVIRFRAFVTSPIYRKRFAVHERVKMTVNRGDNQINSQKE